MPEGPELHLASLFVNRMCEGVVFTGSVKKSQVSKRPEVPFTSEAYRITAQSRGKEVRLTLTPIKSDEVKHSVMAAHADQPMDIIFHFGMSGFFRFTTEDELPKHAHLHFYSNEKPCRVLSFVDARRFGGWQPNGTWQPDRGPCIMFEYETFRENVLTHLSDRAFDRPICETLLNQKYFNGIGNYLRAEILFRLNIQPFVKARTVLEGLLCKDEQAEETTKTEISDQAVKNAKVEPPDLLSLCHTVPLEVVKQGGKGYDPEKADYSVFEAWLQCYCVDGMKSIRDHNSRTIWFKGDPGPMAPRNSKSPKAKKRIKKEDNHDYATQKKGVTKARTVKQETLTEKVKKEKVPEKQTGAKSQRIQNSKEMSTPQQNKRAAARKKSNSTDNVVQRSGRVTRQSSK
ncbi:endonuclease 8-like 1 isoform X2 [Hypomesus transpacificus]|uniref:endonuclease 8-like 1 isoform X2 n=1 Tax=Hypomesus transpacificus TaxID=137520 RepID=UPI001F087436|nr:endonuclease 8-like 1 isoform X2 [Hypomesus transpacificus]